MARATPQPRRAHGDLPLLAPLPPPRRGGAHTPAVAGAGEALQLAAFARQHGGAVLCIVRAPLDAYHLLEELAFLAPDVPCRHLPDWETLPYDGFSPPPEGTAARIAALAALYEGRPGITLTTAAAAALPCPPPAFIAARALALRVGETLHLPALQTRLQQGGYARVERVLAPGEFAVYGGQVDIYPPDAAQPLRVVLAEDEIEQLRLFDPQTQRSTARITQFSALSVSECDLSDAGRTQFAARYDAAFPDDRALVKQRILAGEAVPGMEYYLPLFYETAATLFDYLGEEVAVLAQDALHEALTAFLHQARLRQKIVSNYENRPALPSGKLFLSEENFAAALQQRQLLILTAAAAETLPPQVPVQAQLDNPHARLLDFIRTFDGSVLLTADGEGRAEALSAVLAADGLHPQRADTFAACRQHPLAVAVAPLRSGFVLPEAHLAVLTEVEIFQTALPPRARRQQSQSAARALDDDIQEGEFVVHPKYGIGRSHGLKNMTFGEETGEYLEVEYAGTQRLFLPITQLHQITRHQGGCELSDMNSMRWRKRADKAQKRARDAAARLLEINARRSAAKVQGKRPDRVLLAKFTEKFRHAETPDQKRAADETLADLCSAKPMDRLLAADVGFGKTEVAMRAAAATAFAGAQTAMLAPTTLLAQQHERTFTERFAGFPVRVALLTRLTPVKARRATLQAFAAGEVDILIGTHILLGKAVRPHNLGLLVIDEEHRFGVRHKEKFKAMRAGVDILSLSATPIPRTLSMALGGVRDLSLISTPPANRLQVKTTQAPFSHAVVAEACGRELMRGGQVFFIHNEIASLEAMARQLARWLPDARVITAHGGMNGGELENAMRRFLRREGDILLCTTIVESGLDIGNANTIVINRADKMGLSRLHQLRGRVGRGNVQAYAYFLHPMEGEIGRQAQARLDAAEEHAMLGGGFHLALRDLEIRGAGELLGERQSGDIEAVGVAMYQRMVQRAARQLAGTPEVESDIEVSVQLPQAALLPAVYIPAAAERMRYYRRLAACTDAAGVDDIYAEWHDRFGKPPPPAWALKASHHLRLHMQPCGAESLRLNGNGEAVLTFIAAPPCSAQLVQQIRQGACLPHGTNSVKVALPGEGMDAHLAHLGEFLHTLRRPAGEGGAGHA